MNNPAFPDFGNLWRDLLRQWEDAANSLGTDAMTSPEFSKFMNQATSSSAPQDVSIRLGSTAAATAFLTPLTCQVS